MDVSTTYNERLDTRTDGDGDGDGDAGSDGTPQAMYTVTVTVTARSHRRRCVDYRDERGRLRLASGR